MFWLNIPLLVDTNMTGDVPRSPHKYPVVSHLQMMKRSLELWSLTWQSSRLTPSQSPPPPNMKVKS